MNIMPKMIYNCLDEDPLIHIPHQLQLADSTVLLPFGIVKDVLVEFQGSSTLVDSLVVDMDPRQQTSIILGESFLKSVEAGIDENKGIIHMKVDGISPP